MDPSWCPACDRLILPKRYLVPVSTPSAEHVPPPPPAPTPVPSSPEVRKKPLPSTRLRAFGGGLVHGTGRVRPGGGLKPRETKKPPVSRVVISQEPTPLYCSDECRARDLKNSFLDSESPSFSGAPAAKHHAAQLERVQKTVQDVMKSRRSVNSLPDLSSASCRPISISSVSSSSTASSSRLPALDSKNSTIRPSPRSRPPLPVRTGSFSAWASPSKAALVPPSQTLYTASSSSSIASSVSSLFDHDSIKLDDDDSSATTPSRRGSGSSGASKKQKRVSFASDSKPPTPINPAVPRRRNPFLDANPLRDAISLSPKDRVKPASLPSDLLPPSTTLRPSHSTPSLVVDSPSSSNRYAVAMWPEDEKRTTECARVHGTLLREYAMRFRPREGRSLVCGRLWDEGANKAATGVSPLLPTTEQEARRAYWRAFEEREAEARARRKVAAAVQREEEERVICELLAGTGMREEDQPQARRMKQMAYDGMPGPAELRGLTYKFDRFLYPLLEPKPTIVEKTVRRWDEARQEWVEETTREEVYQERKKLFNFVED